MSDLTGQETLSKIFHTLWTKPTAYTSVQMKLPSWIMWWMWRSLTNGYCLKMWYHKNRWCPFVSLKKNRRTHPSGSSCFRLCHETLCFVKPPQNSCDMDVSQNVGPLNPHVSWVISDMPEALQCLPYHSLPSGKVFFSRFPRIAERLTEKECERSNEWKKWGKTWDVVLGSDFFDPNQGPEDAEGKSIFGGCTVWPCFRWTKWLGNSLACVDCKGTVTTERSQVFQSLCFLWAEKG